VKRVAAAFPPEPPPRLVVEEAIRRALAEDLGRAGDITTDATVEWESQSSAAIVARRLGVLAGLPVAREVFRLLDAELRFDADTADGEALAPGATIARLAGRSRPLLTGERTALNFLGHLSGIATATRRLVDDVAGTKATIVCTRKTTPGLRALEKYAVRCGGGTNHRQRLDDGILIKDNHIRLAGIVGRAVTRMRKANREMPTEVEAQTLDQVNEALEAGADIVLLDNMSTSEIREAVNRCRGRAKTEISGGVTLTRMGELAATGADFVSIGALTHSAPAADLSFEIEPA
jgi:nicotinate-nucleotide pyrophosphorylase (carboxylating)